MTRKDSGKATKSPWELDPEGVFEVVNETPICLGPHRSGRSDVLTAPIRIKAIRPESALLEASIGERTNLALLDGIPEPPPPPPIKPPDEFRFENTSYTIGINRRKSIALWAPAALAEPTSKIVQVTSDNEGVTVLDGGTTTMSLNEEHGFYVGTIRIAGSQLGARATLYANLEQHTAQSHVNVVSRDTGIPDLRIRLTANDVGSLRSYFEPPEPGPDGQTLWVAIKHPSLLPLIKEDRSGEHTPRVPHGTSRSRRGSPVGTIGEKRTRGTTYRSNNPLPPPRPIPNKNTPRDTKSAHIAKKETYREMGLQTPHRHLYV